MIAMCGDGYRDFAWSCYDYLLLHFLGAWRLNLLVLITVSSRHWDCIAKRPLARRIGQQHARMCI